jgi:NAD+ kinase
MKRIAIFGKKHMHTGLDLLAGLFDQLMSHSGELQLYIRRDYYTFLTRAIGLTGYEARVFDTYDGSADLVLSVGGDGTFLTSSAAVGAYETPIMGINSGHLGFLSAADLCDAGEIVNEIVSGDYAIQKRSLIEVSGSDELSGRNRYALNEIAILKQDTASMVTLETTLNGRLLANYRGDGLIVSTPTGSTGYNLSVGGPIVAPTATNWIVAPVAAHSLTMRPLVISDDAEMRVDTHGRSDHFLLAVDGKSTPLPIGTSLTLRKAPHCVKLVTRLNHNFTDTLREKLLWGI